MAKSIYDYSHIKSVSALIILDSKKEIVGKIIANWSDNPAGSVCTAQVFCDSELLKRKRLKYPADMLGIGGFEYDAPMIGKAGGYGYDKLSSAISQAIRSGCIEHPKTNFAGAGLSEVKAWFQKELGLTLFEVI